MSLLPGALPLIHYKRKKKKRVKAQLLSVKINF